MTGRLVLLLAAGLLASCQFAVRVSVGGTAEAPVIELDRGGGAAPAISGLSIGTDGVPGTVWSIVGDRCTEVSRIVYGQAPPGFREQAPAPRLETGRNYDVYLTGCGATGGARFAVVGDEIVSTGH